MKTALAIAILLLCSVAQAQQVRLDLFPAAEPTKIELFPTAAPVRLELFAAPVKRSKAIVPAPIEGPVAELPVVYVYHVPWCSKDRGVLAEYHTAVAAGESLPFRMVSHPGPDWVQVCPTIRYPSRRSPDGRETIQGNWPGLREFTRIFEAAQVKQRVHRADHSVDANKMVSQPISTRELIRRMPPNHGVWDHPYDLHRHIREHGFTGSLDGLSWQDLEKLHDGLHEGLIPLNPPVVIQSPVREQSYRQVRTYRQMSRSSGKQFDPFLAISILGIVFQLLGNCNK